MFKQKLCHVTTWDEDRETENSALKIVNQNQSILEKIQKWTQKSNERHKEVTNNERNLERFSHYLWKAFWRKKFEGNDESLNALITREEALKTKKNGSPTHLWGLYHKKWHCISWNIFHLFCVKMLSVLIQYQKVQSLMWQLSLKNNNYILRN